MVWARSANCDQIYPVYQPGTFAGTRDFGLMSMAMVVIAHWYIHDFGNRCHHHPAKDPTLSLRPVSLLTYRWGFSPNRYFLLCTHFSFIYQEPRIIHLLQLMSAYFIITSTSLVMRGRSSGYEIWSTGVYWDHHQFTGWGDIRMDGVKRIWCLFPGLRTTDQFNHQYPVIMVFRILEATAHFSLEWAGDHISFQFTPDRVSDHTLHYV